jgi:thioredoxin-like negative regulator of GroEL
VLIGCLAKETALFAFGGAVCILFALARTRVASLGAAVRLALPGTLLWCVGVLAYLGIRYWGLSGRDTGVGAILKSAGATAGVYGWADQVRVAVKVSGFYAKKIFFPYPLNFAITEISDLYLAVGCLLLIVIVWLVRRGDLPAALFLACILTASSALLVVFGKMAWTLLAERYLYLPSTFFVLGWTALAASGVNAQIVRGLTVTMLAFVVLWGALTIQRAQLWSDPVALLEDTVNKSPNFMQTRKDLANYYLARGETTKARQLLESVVQDAHGTDYVAGDVSMALHLAKEGQLVEAHRLLTLRLQTSGKNYVNVTEALLKINDQRLVEAAAASDRLDIHRENIKLLEALLQRNRDPFLEYRLAKECLASGDAKRARTLFESSYRKAPDSAHYKAAARKLADKLAAEDHG